MCGDNDGLLFKEQESRQNSGDDEHRLSVLTWRRNAHLSSSPPTVASLAHRSAQDLLLPVVQHQSERSGQVTDVFPRIAPDVRSVPTSRRRSEEHTYELQSLMRISYAVFF